MKGSHKKAIEMVSVAIRDGGEGKDIVVTERFSVTPCRWQSKKFQSLMTIEFFFVTMRAW
jgi:hypothetical protein